MTDFATLLDDVRRRLDDRLAVWLAPRVAAANAVSPEAGTVAEAAADLTLRGGKRMRAALVAIGYAAADAEARDAVTVCEPAMMAFELLQTYLLIHDDWMDHDEVRRGGPAVHAILRAKLGTGLFDAAAVLAGDLTSGWAQDVLLETALPAERLLAAVRAYARIQVEVVHGQLAEMQADRARMGKSAPPATVETVHLLKTASYTTTGPLLLGAALAGATEARTKQLEAFGNHLGIAFQLRDDVLGVFGDPAKTGKPIHNDIREGKRTALVEELEKDVASAPLLAKALGRADASAEDLAAVARAMQDTGALARVDARVKAFCADAERVLQDDGSDALAHGPRVALGRDLGARGALCVTGAAHGKVILFGEHAVVHGVPAIAVGIDRGASATSLSLASGPSTLSVRAWNTRVTSEGDASSLGRAFHDLVAETRNAPLAIDATADLPPGGGLGCSAALGVAIARALDPAATDETIIGRASVWERVFHGNPSGVDVACAALGGCVQFERTADAAHIDRVRVPGVFHLCIGNTGQPSSTKTMVEAVGRQLERRPDTTKRTFEAIRTLVSNARLAIEAGDRRAVGQLLDLNQMLLSGLFVSTPEIESMCASARVAGAHGAKLTGAGGGGSVVALVDSPEVGGAVLTAWKADGYDGFLTTFGTSDLVRHAPETMIQGAP